MPTFDPVAWAKNAVDAIVALDGGLTDELAAVNKVIYRMTMTLGTELTMPQQGEVYQALRAMQNELTKKPHSYK